MTGRVNSYTMPFSNVAHLPLAKKLRATQVAGYTDLSLMPYEVEQMASKGISPTELKKRAEDAGITIGRLDPLNTWPRIWAS
jgi:sugar phosphate isomerase/epimerase